MATNYLKPQEPLKKIDKDTGDINYLYPLVTSDQVILEDGTRLNTILNEHILYLGDAEDDVSIAPVIADNGIYTYVHSIGTLIGSGENGKFKATATGTYTAFTIGGVSYAVKAGGETEIELTSGVWYSFILDTGAKTINFKAGGGVSNSKLAATTAATGDVLSGSTFYSGNKELKTGTLALSGDAVAGDVLKGKTFYNTDAKTKQTGTLETTAKYTAHRSSYNNAVGGLTSGKIYLVVCAYEWTDSIYITGGGTTLASLGTMDHTSERVTLFVVRATSTSISVNNPNNSYMCVCAVPLN